MLWEVLLDRDRDRGVAAVRRAVVRAVGERVGADEARGRGVDETAVDLENQGTVSRIGNQLGRQLVAVGVLDSIAE
jgi:hypothetical protein